VVGEPLELVKSLLVGLLGDEVDPVRGLGGLADVGYERL
jgi:hypothetical protein